MKNSITIVFIIVQSIVNTVNAEDLTIFQSVTVENDVTKDGVKGFNVICIFNFLPLEELNQNDTILKNASFQFKTTFTEKGLPVKTALGYKSVTNNDGNAEFTAVLSAADISVSKNDRKLTQFVPYAALKLNEGKHVLHIKSVLSGIDGIGKYYKYTLEKTADTLSKPPTKTFTMDIDYIEVNTMDSKGQAWDYAFFKTDAPDVGVNILMGNTSVYKTNVNDTYMFAVGPNSRNIAFAISENDRVTVMVQDIDVLFHDFIARWNFTTDDKKNGTVYTYNKVKGNIKSCNLNFRID